MPSDGSVHKLVILKVIPIKLPTILEDVDVKGRVIVLVDPEEITSAFPGRHSLGLTQMILSRLNSTGSIRSCDDTQFTLIATHTAFPDDGIAGCGWVS